MTPDANGIVLVLDPSCSAAHGHHLNSLLDLAAALSPRPLTLVVNTAMPTSPFPPGITVQRCFETTVYDEPGLGPRPNGRLARRLWKLRRTMAGAAATTSWALATAAAPLASSAQLRAEDWDWSRWRRKWPTLQTVLEGVAVSPVAHIIAPSADVELICGLASLRTQIAALRCSQIHARLITLTPTLARLHQGPAATKAYRGLMAERMDGVHLYVETPAMQRQIATDYQLESAVYPYLLAPPAFVETGRPAGVAFGYFGGMRNEKGFHRLLPILRRVAARLAPSDPPLSVLIHGSDAHGEAATALMAAFDAVAKPGLTVQFIAGPLSAEDYQRRFSKIDAALLPYTGMRYALSGSGIVCEAVSQGKAIITSKGLSFGGMCDETHAIFADDDDAFATAILTIARNIAPYRTAAAARARRYQSEVKACPLLARLGATQ